MAHKLPWMAGIHGKLMEAFCAYVEAGREFDEALEAASHRVAAAGRPTGAAVSGEQLSPRQRSSAGK
jgi:hypothetical protein